MKTEKIEIEDGVYNKELLKCLWHKKIDNSFDKELLELLQKLCKYNLIERPNISSNLLLTDKEKEMLNSIDIISVCSNKEIIARWCDYVQDIDKNKRPSYIKVCSSNYGYVYITTKNHEYLIRRLQLIRKAKELFKTELEEVYTATKEEITKCNSSYWQKLLLTEFVSIFGTEKTQQNFSDFLEEKIEIFNQEQRFEEARFCIDSLRVIESLTLNQWHIRKAENFEKEGDYIDNNRKTNTYYPTLSNIYLKGLKEINSILNCDTLKKRLENKVVKTQGDTANMIQSVGIPIITPIDYKEIHRMISELNIDSFDSAFKELMLTPIVSESIINNPADISKRNSSPVKQYFSQSVKLNDKGAKTGIAIGDEMHINIVRINFREKYIAIIKVTDVTPIYSQIKQHNFLVISEELSMQPWLH